MLSTSGAGTAPSWGDQFGTPPGSGGPLGLWVLPGRCWLPAAEPSPQSLASCSLDAVLWGRGEGGTWALTGGQGRGAAAPAGGVSIPERAFTGGFFWSDYVLALEAEIQELKGKCKTLEERLGDALEPLKTPSSPADIQPSVGTTADAPGESPGSRWGLRPSSAVF